MLDRHITVIVKLTNACDLRCRYCFIEPDVAHRTMEQRTARHVVRAFLDSEYFEAVQFVWHGGEPLLLGPPYLERLFAEQAAQPTRVRYANALQTNGTLLDESTLDMLLAKGVEVGLSLDGPPELNERTRRPARKSPTSAHASTLAAAARMRSRGLRPGAIVVVSRANVDRPEALYTEFVRRRLHMKLNPLTVAGRAAGEGADLQITPVRYGRFLVRLFDCWFDDRQPTITIDPFHRHVARIMGEGGSLGCYFETDCHRRFLGIAPDGSLYPCGMYQGDERFRYGDIHGMAPEEVVETELYRRLEERQQAVETLCEGCAFQELCHGGCAFRATRSQGDTPRKDPYCAAYHLYFEHALRRIHAELLIARSPPAEVP